MWQVIERWPWLPWALLLATMVVVVLVAGIGMREPMRAPAPVVTDVEATCPRPELMQSGIRIDVTGAANVASVRNIVDRGSQNYQSPTDARWGVLGRFPGDTTIELTHDPHRISIRFHGRPGEPLAIEWAGRRFPIVAIYGGGAGWRQRYVTTHDGLHYMLPVQWNEESSTWESYAVERWLGPDGPRTPKTEDSLEGRCSDCHRDGILNSSRVVFTRSDG